MTPDTLKGSILVVKLGGRSIETESGRAQLARRLAQLRASGHRLVVVHGGGAQVTAAMEATGIEARFVEGLRVTDGKTLEVAEPVFAHLGKLLAHALTDAGASAIALTGRDARLLVGRAKDPRLGRVGTIEQVDADLLRHLAFNGVTPVVGPIAVDGAGALNVNADEVAASVAKALGARELLLLTDVPGVRGADGALLPRLAPDAARRLVAEGVATGGMIPKVHGALDALASGVARVRVLDEPGLERLAAGAEAGTVFA
ncbi:MAG TPA: acetylglutamate kinase [Candidatus Thermoplasmatota archaeon]|nr:acetylglutamate kinase [Candidatus Thermoplasmatota archaeon]